VVTRVRTRRVTGQTVRVNAFEAGR
jgi:hypothetical protein